MKRIDMTPRPDWKQRCEKLGFDFHSVDDGYWNEAACYEFSEHELGEIEAATEELHSMCLEAVAHVLKNEMLYRYQIPPDMYGMIYDSWARGDKCLYGRFDLAYDGVSSPKMLEYNADTPTGLLEAADVQRDWRKSCLPDRGQFNSLWTRLIESWKGVCPAGSVVHFSCVEHSPEDYGTVNYIRSAAKRAGLQTEFLYIQDIEWSECLNSFVDRKAQETAIRYLFKLYPWEWMVIDPFHKYLATTNTRFVEPAWKMLLSNKALLPVLWELFPRHPYLLPASFYAHELNTGNGFVRKPLLSREGANISIQRAGGIVESTGTYGAEGYIYQEFFQVPCLNGRYPVIGSWVMGGKAAGIGIREDAGLITRNTSWFVPHVAA